MPCDECQTEFTVLEQELEDEKDKTAELEIKVQSLKEKLDSIRYEANY